jgi:hypothetical protein
MKTPRQILFQRHRSVESKLDALRAKALGEMSRAKAQRREEKVSDPLAFFASWRVMFLSLRCHIAGMSAIWLLVIFLNIDFSSVSNGEITHPSVAQQKAPSPQQVVMDLLENRRQIIELTASSANGNPPPVHTPQSFIPPRRSEFPSPTQMA